MSLEEIRGERNLVYSEWHRPASMVRFINDPKKVETMSYIDIDCAEYHDDWSEVLVLIETAIDVGQDYKPVTVTFKLAQRIYPPIPVFLVLYKISKTMNPTVKKFQIEDIEAFRIKQISPKWETDFTIMTPKQWAEKLLQIREDSAAHMLECGKQRELGHLRAVWKKLSARERKMFWEEIGKKFRLTDSLNNP
jgi:hypothetical protein